MFLNEGSHDSEGQQVEVAVAVHIDNESIIWIDTRKKEYEIIDIKSDKYWANKAFKLIKKQLDLKSERAEHSTYE